jgi:hypothetical protein
MAASSLFWNVTVWDMTTGSFQDSAEVQLLLFQWNHRIPSLTTQAYVSRVISTAAISPNFHAPVHDCFIFRKRPHKC